VIFDEIITWPRVGFGGAQGRLDLRPDLTTIGKNLGGGYPLAAYGGRADIMRVLAPEGPTFAGGTHAGNPFAIAIGLRALGFLEANEGVFAQMRELGARLAVGIRAVLAQLRLDYAVVHLESIVDFKFRPGPPTRSYDDQRFADARAYAAYYHEMRARGVLLPPSQNEVMFLCTEHTQHDVDETLDALQASVESLRQRSIV
ncbi:MAG: aminotransferase class III-fold pyridoxal phosphate-dependent enzyme, partial [Vulcanimicrobiaceae bacterium]